MLKRLQFLFLTVFSLASVFLFVSGCSSLFSEKKPEDLLIEIPVLETEDGKPRLVGDCAAIGNFQTVAVHGFGLVVDLPGTGGDDVNTEHYRQVEDSMTRMGINNIRSLLASPQTAVVEIVGYMRPGIQSNDRFDVQIMLPTYPQESSTKSLRGGRLMTAKLSEMATFGGELKKGETRALVEGPIMVDDPLATETSNPAGLKKGTILSGAVALKPRSLSLIMKEDSRSVFLTERIAKAINQRFFLPTGSDKGVANAKDDSMVVLDIHPSYANDVPRYVRVIQSVACSELPVQRIKRIERLTEELQHPETSQQAAFQLEAIGKAGIEPLKQALNSPDAEVRFHAATSLAYLGDGTPAKVLAETAAAEQAFRVYALNALSVMKNELDAESCLQELLHVPSAETRYGAFRALKLRNPMDQTIRGENLGGQFSYHGIPTASVPMVHITTNKYPEVVLFGSDIALTQPFALDAGPMIYINGQTPGTVVVSKFENSGVDEKRTVSNRLDEIIRAVVELKGTYPDVVQLLRQADMMRVLPCRLEVDRLPEPNRIYVRQGSTEPEVEVVKEEEPKSFWNRLNPKNLFVSKPKTESGGEEAIVNTSSRD